MFCGLDLGTTNIKALLVDDAGQVVARSSAPVSINHTADTGVEQDIAEIWSATLAAIKQLGTEDQRQSVRAVGISAQGAAMLITDGDGNPVGPVIGWMDGRGAEYNQRLTERLGREWFIEHIGHACSNLCLGQLLRLHEESPDLLAEPNRVGFVGDVIVSRLCGRAAHDATSLSIAWLYNPSLRDADSEALGLVGVSPSQLPALLTVGESAGGLLECVAAETSLPADIPVSPAVHDQYAAAVGSGSVQAGDVMFGTGTAWVLLAATDRLAPPVRDEGFVCTHVIDGLYGQMLSMVNGGSAFAWAVDTLGLADKSGSEIDELMSAVPAGCDGLRCAPTFTAGGGVEAGGAQLTGLRLSHTPGHVLRSVAEGLAWELTRYLGFLTAADMPVSRLVMTGGAAASTVTPQIIADVAGVPLICCTETDTSAFGAAVIARGLTDSGTDLTAISQQMAPAGQPLTPGDDQAVYKPLFDEYLGRRGM
ncbi:MAG: xylulokinase [Planctomycetota bacterium]|jgi:sugar (pentulose or hexulose) kinase